METGGIRVRSAGGIAVHLGASAAVVVLAAALYANALNGPFVFDDLPHIVHNPSVQVAELGLAPLGEAAFGGPAKRPLPYVTFALNHAASGLDVFGYHVVNVAIHAVNGVLVYILALLTLRLAARLPGQRWTPRERDAAPVALLCALVFTAHPIQVQSVTYVVQRMNAMAASFMLAALLCYVGGRTARERGARVSAFSGAAGCWVLALGCKQIALVLPFTALLYEWYFFRDLSRDWLRRAAPIAAGALILLAVLGWIYSDGLAALSYAERAFTPWERVLTQWRVVVFYLGLLLLPLPSRLNLVHTFPLSTSLIDPPTTFLALAAILGLLALAVWTAPSRRLVSFCIVWFFLHLALESSFVPLELVYEHRLYFPLFGVALLASALLTRTLRARPLAAVVVAGCLVAALGAGTVLRNRTWQDAIVFWLDAVAKSPADARARYNLAFALDGRRRRASAIEHYGEALRLDPDYAQAHNGIAVALEGEGRAAEALHHYAEGARLDPRNPVIRTNLGLLLEREGRVEEALAAYEEVVRAHPEHAKAHLALGGALGRQQRVAEALPHLEEAVRLDPTSADARAQLGIALAATGRFAEARAQLLEAVRLDPEDAAIRRTLDYVQRGSPAPSP